MNGSTIIEILSEDKEVVPYRKSLRRATGSVTATILLGQMMFYARQKDWMPFYKFKEKCGHELYRDGDSWTEEIGFSSEEFDAAIKRIGTKINKDSDKEAIYNPPEGIELAELAKHIVIYWIDPNRRTWWHVNVSVLGRVMEQIYVNRETRFRKTDKPGLRKPGNPAYIYSETTTENTTERGGNTVNEQIKDPGVHKASPPPAAAQLNSAGKNGHNNHPVPAMKQAIDGVMGVAKNYGLNPAEFRILVDKVLELVGNKDLADTDTQAGCRALSDAQETMSTLLQLNARLTTPDALDKLLAVWKAKHWLANKKNEKRPTYKGLIEIANGVKNGDFNPDNPAEDKPAASPVEIDANGDMWKVIEGRRVKLYKKDPERYYYEPDQSFMLHDTQLNILTWDDEGYKQHTAEQEKLYGGSTSNTGPAWAR